MVADLKSAHQLNPSAQSPSQTPTDPPSHASITSLLCDLAAGESGVVQESAWRRDNSALLESYGFFPGSTVTRVGSAPQGDPLVFRLERRLVAVRRETASNIAIVRENT